MTAPRSALAPFAALAREPDESHARAAAASAWHATGLVLINPEWMRSWADRKQLEILAEKMFGKRKGQTNGK